MVKPKKKGSTLGEGKKEGNRKEISNEKKKNGLTTSFLRIVFGSNVASS